MVKDGKRMARMMDKDVSQITMESFFQSIGTLRETNLYADLHKIKVPTLGIYGKRDIIVNPNQRNLLSEGVSHAKIEYILDAGHFPMLDTPDRFINVLREFLKSKSD
jgi:pimeloyl-ACP methyl ester carboxylesterase